METVLPTRRLEAHLQNLVDTFDARFAEFSDATEEGTRFVGTRALAAAVYAGESEIDLLRSGVGDMIRKTITSGWKWSAHGPMPIYERSVDLFY